MRLREGHREHDRQSDQPGTGVVTTPSALVEELRAAGVPVESLSDLVNAKRSYRRAVPVLLDWLQKLDAVPAADRPKVHEMLVRSLSVPAARGVAGPVLVEQFRRVDDPSGLGIRWVIANALSVVADDSVFDDLVELARDRSYGRAREMLMLELAQTMHPRQWTCSASCSTTTRSPATL